MSELWMYLVVIGCGWYFTDTVLSIPDWKVGEQKLKDFFNLSYTNNVITDRFYEKQVLISIVFEIGLWVHVLIGMFLYVSLLFNYNIFEFELYLKWIVVHTLTLFVFVNFVLNGWTEYQMDVVEYIDEQLPK